MKGVVFPGDRRAEVREFPVPEPGPGEVVVRMKAAGLCGSDLHLYRQTSEQRAGDDTIPGHEPSGVVETIGEGVRTVHAGDRVAVYHYRGCGHCKYCLAGYIQWCPERRGYGGPIHGSDADFLLTDERNCLPLPEELSFVHGAAIACYLGTAFSSMRKLQVSGEDTVVIFGQGPVGLGGLLVAKAMGGRVIAIEPSAERRALASALGADATIDPESADVLSAVRDLTRGEGADLAFETAGRAAAQNGAVDCLRNGGRAVFVGFGANEKTLNSRQFIGRELTLMGSFVMPVHMYWDLVDLIIEHELPVEKMVTHRFAIDEAPEAFRLFDEGKTGKVIFEWA
jgi:threonine dehydrogenase-like Zn-dependent dehydrogenase